MLCPSYLAASCRVVPIEASDGVLSKDRKNRRSASLEWQDDKDVKTSSFFWKKVEVENQKLTYTRAATRGSEVFICEHVPGVVLQNRAAHGMELNFVRQVARKPQPPIELRVVQFS